jgi:hypothetical protein
MGRSASRSKAKHTITWEQFVAFADKSGRDLTHAFRVFKGERQSQALDQEFEQHFGFRMRDAALAGRKKARV